MQIQQRTEQRHLLVPSLQHSLAILSLPLPELKKIIEEELLNNPFLEEIKPTRTRERFSTGIGKSDSPDFTMDIAARKTTLQETLMRQLGMFSSNQDDIHIGELIIGNIDDNGYLSTDLPSIAQQAGAPLEQVERTLQLIQDFDPPGVGARNIQECLLIQLKVSGELNQTLERIITSHLDDIAKKNYSKIAKSIGLSPEHLEPILHKILRLDPKPGRAYSAEQTFAVIPDVVINGADSELDVTVNDDEIPTLNINKDYKQYLKKKQINPETKAYLSEKLENAMELMRALTRRKQTLKKIIENLMDTQAEAIESGLEHLKPLTFRELAERINVHETTVCRAVMNKYIQLPHGIFSLKDFFTTSIKSSTGGTDVSSTLVKTLIKNYIEAEDKKHPVSDQEIAHSLTQEKSMTISRRTVAKYREELKIPSTSYRRIK